jgi:4-diphosphocytidyl-2-C-methyl-D-erythritol kinase
VTSDYVPAYAKINLALYVLGRRRDGYHEIATVLQAVDLCDQLEFAEAAEGARLECSDPTLPVDSSNLVIQAARILEVESGRSLPVHIRLRKEIPIGAGLGGGSSDAAATLWALNRRFRLGMASDRLGELAAELGSDVPFFLGAGQALARGRGERLVELEWPLDYHVLIAYPQLPLTAADGYARAQIRLTNPLGDGRFQRCLAPEEFLDWIGSQTNDLAAGVSEAHPIVARGIEAMRALGAFHTAMSGSGSAVFGLFRHSLSTHDLKGWPAEGTWVLKTAQPIRASGHPLPAYRRGSQGS